MSRLRCRLMFIGCRIKYVYQTDIRDASEKRIMDRFFTKHYLKLPICVLLLVISVGARDPKYQVLLVSMDGFRWDYVNPVSTPNFDALAREGVKAPYINNTFITKTFPCHYSIATGKLFNVFLSFFLYILLHPLSRIMSTRSSYTPV